jgi:hypothetical protein
VTSATIGTRIVGQLDWRQLAGRQPLAGCWPWLGDIPGEYSPGATISTAVISASQ